MRVDYAVLSVFLEIFICKYPMDGIVSLVYMLEDLYSRIAVMLLEVYDLTLFALM
jgi:hypothetical protein